MPLRIVVNEHINQNPDYRFGTLLYPESQVCWSFDIERFDGPLINGSRSEAFLEMKTHLLRELNEAEQFIIHGKKPSHNSFSVEFKVAHRNF